jgi:dUTP pyrophosphatase
MLNAQQILDQSLLKLSLSQGKAAQVGYDLSIKSINKIGNGVGKVLKNETKLNKYTPITPVEIYETKGYLLSPGAYDVTFHEGCNIPNDKVGLIRQRSSLLRNGAIVHSSVFDPGFSTDNMGTIMIVTEDIFIEEDARVAQMYFHTCEPVMDDKLYNGQWQNDKQRSSAL